MAKEVDSPVSANRRALMKAVGAGAALAALGGRTVAQTDGTATETPTEDGDGEQEMGTVHQVETLISAPPTNPDRPADFFYQPTGVHVQPGDVVQFVLATPDHNVVSYHPAFGMARRVPVGVQAFSSPLLGWRPASIPGDQVQPPGGMGGDDGDGGDGGQEPGGDGGPGAGTGGPTPDTWLYAFETPGVYDLLCSPHEHFGMAMRVVVGDEMEAPFETADPTALQPPRAGPAELARETLTDPALEPAAIVEAGSVTWGDLEATQGEEATETPTG